MDATVRIIVARAAALQKIICVNNGQARPQHHETSADPPRPSWNSIKSTTVTKCPRVSLI